jgi:3-isopropylmalate/(R)-2-methylmalate dehydratase large subunit
VGFATPGAFVMHHDPHIAQLGTFGALALGVRRNLLEAFISETVALQVPRTVRVELTGKPLPGIMGRDIFHHIVRVLGPMGGRSGVLELAGPALDDISIEGLQTITGLAMFVGAASAIVNPDQRLLSRALPLARKKIEPVFSDPDADYDAEHRIDISDLEPIVVIPPNPANTRNLADYAGTDVQVGYIGSCASGRLEDIRAAATVLKGRKVRKGFMLNIVPTSQKIMAAAAREGLIEILVEAGAFVSSPSCDYCYGRIATMAPGQRAVSTGTLNVPGRMGSADSEIYIASAASVAAAAIDGRIADPRQYL